MWTRRALQAAPRNHVSRAGRSRTYLEPRIRRLPRRSATARCQRPVRESNPSHLLDKQGVTPASSQGKQSAWRESNPPVRHGEPVPGPLGHRRFRTRNSKGGRSRTLCVRVGAVLLSQEHTPVGQRKGQDSNLQGLSPRPVSNRVPSCLLARPSVSSCPGRTRTCNHLLNRQPHNPLCYGTVSSVPAAGVEPAAFAFSARRSYHLSYTGVQQRSWWESNPRQAVLQTAALPLDHRIMQSRRWDSNPLVPRYEDGARPVEHRRPIAEQPVLVSSQLDRGSEPQSPSEGLARIGSCRSRTCSSRFRRPGARIRETTPSTPCRSRTGQPAFGGPVLGPQDRVSFRQGVRGELNPPPRPSQGRMLASYTTNTIARSGPWRESNPHWLVAGQLSSR
jgi:hypothetical protein